MTVGSPCAAGLPGNEEIHLSIAKPPPSAGIARKSPWGGRGQVDLGGHRPSPAWWARNAARTCSMAAAGGHGCEDGVVIEDGEVGHERAAR